MNATLTRLTRRSGDLLAGDGVLLEAYLNGDPGAFAVLVRRHASLVFATCRRILRHQQDAEDAFQATFLVLARRGADVWPREAVGSWLFGVAHRVALKARAVRSRRTARQHPLEEVACSRPAPPDFDLADVVHRVVARLPEVYRAAVVACDLQGLSRKEAAQRLGWTEGTLSGRLARARTLLARRFQRLGLALPTGGLVAVLTAPQAVSAATVQTTIELAAGTATISASAPVAALTEGVVRSMFLVKLKMLAAAAVVVTACALGFSAIAATGAGTGDGPPDQNPPAQGQRPPRAPVGVKPAEPPAKPPAAGPIDPHVELARRELELLRQEFATAGKGKLDQATLERFLLRLDTITQLLSAHHQKPRANPVTDRDRLQGTWRIISLTEGEKTTPTNPRDPWAIEVGGSTLRMPYLEGGAGTSGTSSAGSSGSSGTAGIGWKQREYTFAVDGTKTPRTIDLFVNNKPLGRGIYEFTAAADSCLKCHKSPDDANNPFMKQPRADVMVLCEPGLKKVEFGARLALSIDGTRPEKFGGPGVIVFELKRQESEDAERAQLREAQSRLEKALRAASMEKAERARLEAELKAQVERLEVLAGREEQRRALIQLRQAQADLENARARALAAEADLQRATLLLKEAQQKAAAAERAVANLKQPRSQPDSAPPEAVFTVHVRPLTEAEKVVRVKATGKETVLEGLAYATDVAPIKSGEVSVWVVRDKEVLPVDLPAITRNADPKSNYTLKPGDQLFIQIRPGK